MSDAPALVVESRDALAEARCSCGHPAADWHTDTGCHWLSDYPVACTCRLAWSDALLASGVVTIAPALAVPDVDALAEALCARPGRGPCAAHRVTAEAVLATDWLARVVADALADGWDKGYHRGTRDAESDLEPADNPYRAALARATEERP